MKHRIPHAVPEWAALFRRLKLALPRPKIQRPTSVEAPPPSVEDLARYLMLSPKNRYAIRPAEEFVPVGTDTGQQVLDLIDHLFVRYPVPRFLYRPMLSNEGVRLVFGTVSGVGDEARMRREVAHRRWFRAVAWGESFALLAKETLNKREAHWFLQAPAHNDIEKNVRWAKVAALGVPPEACDFFLQRFEHHTLSEERRAQLALFYARTWSEIQPHEREEIADFIGSKLYDPTFSFAGRTATSTRKLSEAWHRRFAEYRSFDVSASRTASWRGMFKGWETQIESRIVRAVELTNGGDLTDEGARQGHCVASYSGKCRAGHSRIASLRWLEADESKEIARLTVEVDVATRSVVQVRGRFNRRAATEEWAILRRWAKDQGLRIPLRP